MISALDYYADSVASFTANQSYFFFNEWLFAPLDSAIRKAEGSPILPDEDGNLPGDIERAVREDRKFLKEWFCKRAILDGEKPEIEFVDGMKLPDTDAGLQEMYDERYSVMPHVRPIQ